MTPLEKIAALKAGEIDGLLEKTIYKGAALVSRTMMHGRKELSPNRQMALARFDAKANAAKVEVTKAVLDEVEAVLQRAKDTGFIEPEHSLTLVKQLKKALNG